MSFLRVKQYLPILGFIVVVLLFFRPVLLQGKLLIPADTIVGLYHPFRDLYSKDYPRGIPFKNSLITDPIRQQYPWRSLVISLEKRMELPLWNPYSFSGTPLLANFQSGAFYPLNLFFFVFKFENAWSMLIILQSILAGIFLYFYLSIFNLNKWAKLTGSLVYVFSGFHVAWLEWNTVIHIALWLPLLLLAQEHLIKKISLQWIIIFLIAECSAIFAGHLQVYFYFMLISNLYLITRLLQISSGEYSGKSLVREFVRRCVPFIFLGITVLILTSIQTVPTFQLILQSARETDQGNWQQNGWFIPWQHLIQFIIPDFFGNPTTLNYWGTWNYGEFIGYISIAPLILSLYALFFRHDKKTLFFGSLFFISLIFSLPTLFAKIPYILGIPFISTSQPTRLLFITDFSLAILATLGFDYYIQNKKYRSIYYSVIFVGIIFLLVWGTVYIFETKGIFGSIENIVVTKRNIVLPTIIFVMSSLVFIINGLYKNKKITILVFLAIIVLTIFDVIRFGQKFIPFTDRKYLFPTTQSISFLQNHSGIFRFMSTDSRILPPNFSMMYHLQSIEGYDPLYLLRYAEFIAASERKQSNISPPFGFNRIITPYNYESKIIDLLGVKYVLSLSDLKSDKLLKVFREGETRIYENKNVLPRAFFVKNVRKVLLKEQAMSALFENDFDLVQEAVVEEGLKLHMNNLSVGNVNVSYYSENQITIKTENAGDGFLVLTDSYYPTWKAQVDGIQAKIFRTDYNFRGIQVPKGSHVIQFYINLI